jgi:acetolactate synthase-1/2/3 large subunit
VLRAHDVTALFTLCGDHSNPILDACAREGIRIVDARDERGAAWMAAGWALVTGRPGVCVVSNTPALLNAAVALADANANGVPVVCVTGGVGVAARGLGHPGDADQASIAAPWTKWAGRCDEADALGAAVAQAMWQARAGKPGVAMLEVPLDVQHARAEASDASARLPVARPEPAAAALAEARALLANARAPVILAGSGAFWSGAGDDLRALAETQRIPVFTARAARGLVSDDHELCFGFPNLLGEPAQTIFADADVALVVGCELDLLVGGGNFHAGCAMVRADVDPLAFALGRRAQVELHADARAALRALNEGARALPTQDWLARLRAAEERRRARFAERARAAGSPLHPARLVAEVAAKLPRDAIVSVDAGELALWALDGIAARAPSSFHTSSASRLGALGMGLPMAIGMKLAAPERPVVALCGDGSFGFTALELETAVRHRAPVSVIVGNDAGWGIVRHLQQELHGRALASDLPRAPYEMLAEFAGGVGDAVTTPQQLEIAVTNAIASQVPTLVNAHVDASVRHDAMPLIAAMFAPR